MDNYAACNVDFCSILSLHSTVPSGEGQGRMDREEERGGERETEGGRGEGMTCGFFWDFFVSIWNHVKL